MTQVSSPTSGAQLNKNLSIPVSGSDGPVTRVKLFKIVNGFLVNPPVIDTPNPNGGNIQNWSITLAAQPAGNYKVKVFGQGKEDDVDFQLVDLGGGGDT